MLVYYLLLRMCVLPHRTTSGIKKKEKKGKKKHSDNSSTMNYESIRATALLKYTQAAEAIWGCVKPTTKTNLFIQLRMYSPELPVFSLSSRLSLDWLQVLPKSILGLWISPFIDRRRIGKRLCPDLQCWELLLLTKMQPFRTFWL